MSVSDKPIEYLKRKKAGTKMILQNFSGTMESEAKTNAYWKDQSSHARQSIHSGVEGSGDVFTLFLAHGVKYGIFLEEGTKPHMIRPKGKKALYWGGASHPVKAVKHPGTKKYPILQDTLENNKEEIGKVITRWWADE